MSDASLHCKSVSFDTQNMNFVCLQTLKDGKNVHHIKMQNITATFHKEWPCSQAFQSINITIYKGLNYDNILEWKMAAFHSPPPPFYDCLAIIVKQRKKSYQNQCPTVLSEGSPTSQNSNQYDEGPTTNHDVRCQVVVYAG